MTATYRIKLATDPKRLLTVVQWFAPPKTVRVLGCGEYVYVEVEGLSERDAHATVNRIVTLARKKVQR